MKFDLFTLTLVATVCFAATTASAAPLTQAEAIKTMQTSGCAACHAIDKTLIGPAYKDVAKRYKNPDAATLAYLKGQTAKDYLKVKVRTGSKPGINKNWTKSPEGKVYGMMTPNPVNRISDEKLAAMIDFILALEK